MAFQEVFFVPHAHFDLSWLGTPDECEKINNEIISAALRLLESNESYKYSIECVRPLERFLAANPSESKNIGLLIRAGRLEVGGFYADVASDYCFDESLARNLYQGQRWLERTFGINTLIVREEDVLAHFAQTPQLLRHSGISFYKISRGPAGVFRWIAPDGSGVMTALFEYSHSFHFRLGRTPALTQKNLPGYLRWIKTRIKQPLDSLLIMDGDDCTPPNPNLTEIAEAWNRTHDKPRIRISTVQEYMESIPAPGIPVRSGDIPGFWGGVLLFEQEAAGKLQQVEPMITAAEKFAAVDSVFFHSPGTNLNESWRNVLAAQDHNWGGKDPARHGAQADRDKIRMIDSALDESQKTLESALGNIASKVKLGAPGTPLMVFNPLCWERTDIIDIPLPAGKGGENFAVMDSTGVEIPCQIHPHPKKQSAMGFIAEDVPPLGYKTFYLRERKDKSAPEPKETHGHDRLENQYYRVDLGRNGIRGIHDKELAADVAGFKPPRLLKMAGMEIPFLSLFAVGARFNVPPPEFFENPENLKKGGSGEGIKFLWKLQGPNDFKIIKTEKITGPVSDRLIIHGDFLKCPAAYEIILYHGMKRIDFRVSIEWRGAPGIFLALLFPLPFLSPQIHVNTPFYVHRMGEEAEGFWKLPGSPVQPKLRSIQNWFSMGDRQKTVTIASPWRLWDFTLFPIAWILASDDRGGFFTGENYLQKGTHDYFFSLCSHRGGWKQARAYRHGLEPVYPLIPFVADDYAKSTGELPESLCFCGIHPENVIATALKNAEDNDGSLFIRFYEVEGKETDVTIEFPAAVEKALLTDLIEREQKELEIKGNKVYFKLGPYEIGNAKIFFKGGPIWTSGNKDSRK